MIPRKTVLFASFHLFISISFHFGNSAELLAIDCETAKGVYNVSTATGRGYKDSLESLLEVLVSHAAEPSGFYNYTVGSDEAAVNGLFLCRGDIAAADCQACLAAARPEILQICPNQTGAVIFYDNCILRFSDQSIFASLDTGYRLYYWINQNVSDTATLNKALGDAFNQIITRASRTDVSGRKFAVQEANYTNFQNKIYAMGQCTPDLSDNDCESCLKTAVRLLPECCSSRPGGRVLFPSCNIRYDPVLFYRTLAPPPQPQPITNPPPPPSPPPGHAINQNNRRTSTVKIVVIGIQTAAIVSLVMALFCIIQKAKKQRTPNTIEETSGSNAGVSSSISTDSESLRYSFIQVQNCTNNFEKEIGQGGFGPVYQGKLANGRVVAVKRLSRNSKQGEQEFKNEITLVARLRHRNLVELIGYCLEGEEKILIYEFVVNTSLDKFLFDPTKQTSLNWVTRYMIIKGIVNGLLYLHKHAPVKIIHRDLKASNVLLDKNMSAKIADFGMARLFEIDQSVINTRKIAGTFGYMAPEYAQQGNISAKSDVYSFGVLLLEIISGKMISNMECFSGDDLLTYAWKQWRNETPLSVMDPTIIEPYDTNEVARCIKIGLLCVVQDVGRRPDMTLITKMLDSDSLSLPDPDQPASYGLNGTRSNSREITSVVAHSRVSPLQIEN